MNNYSVSARDAIYSLCSWSPAEHKQGSYTSTVHSNSPTVIYPSKSSCLTASLEGHFYSCLTPSEPDTELQSSGEVCKILLFPCSFTRSEKDLSWKGSLQVTQEMLDILSFKQNPKQLNSQHLTLQGTPTINNQLTKLSVLLMLPPYSLRKC